MTTLPWPTTPPRPQVTSTPQKVSSFLEEGPRHVDNPTSLDKMYESALSVLHKAIVVGTDAREVEAQLNLARSKLDRIPNDFRNRGMYQKLCRDTLDEIRGRRDGPPLSDTELQGLKDQIEKAVSAIEKVKPAPVGSLRWATKLLVDNASKFLGGGVTALMSAWFFQSALGVTFCDMATRVVEVNSCR